MPTDSKEWLGVDPVELKSNLLTIGMRPMASKFIPVPTMIECDLIFKISKQKICANKAETKPASKKRRQEVLGIQVLD
jgi:hypothetical protein